ncbi:hypothetical protein GCM10008018_45190 [Paenibacillus marchantiophytorum]|uniref:Uncharacterized protein n=1 Tax=Paenibacillus marchantiophytorum TaxID=1619310 RepID=A0ABQ1EYS7_9BACL|nr:hypothetical protein [Paenibacillus marchantiophytorum]GFZ93749.1 hypothetical protein GCM10008018_45190 [Paenibacillus marchantiophytorum]
MFLYDYLKTPKSTEELQFVVREKGLNWNGKQVELYALLDQAIFSNERGSWAVQQDDRRQEILNGIEKALGDRPMVKIDPDVMNNISGQYIISMLEVKEIALSVGRYESPRDNILRIKRK